MGFFTSHSERRRAALPEKERGMCHISTCSSIITENIMFLSKSNFEKNAGQCDPMKITKSQKSTLKNALCQV